MSELHKELSIKLQLVPGAKDIYRVIFHAHDSKTETQWAWMANGWIKGTVEDVEKNMGWEISQANYAYENYLHNENIKNASKSVSVQSQDH